jgi:ribonuclease VapC
MVIDTSAFVVIIAREPEKEAMVNAIEIDASRFVSTATILEASVILLKRYGPDAVDDFDVLLARLNVQTIEFDEDQAHIAREAYARFGKGRHVAALNFGDCFVYALAKSRNEPLLFKGNDFSETDIIAVLGG